MPLWGSRKTDYTPREAEHLLLGHLREILPGVLEGFYAWILATPKLLAIIEGTRGTRTVREVVEHLKVTQTEHWLGRLEDGDGDPYRARSEAIGMTHMRIGLPLDFFIEGYRHILTESTLRLAPRLERDPAARTAALVALEKLVIDDLNTIAQAYHAALAARAGEDMAAVTRELRGRVGTAVGTIAGATDELSARAADISGQLEEGGRRIDTAAAQAGQARTLAVRLAELTARIDEIVDFINGISGKINLVALNASIEAARAGDAGRGFGVVAEEVKKLAGSTGQATEEVRAQVGQIREGVAVAAEAIGQLAATVTGMQQLTHAVSTAMREQAAASNAISQNATELTAGVEAFLDELTRLNQAAR